MPASSEGFEDTGLPPNPVVTREERDPFKFDPQTAEIFLIRLCKALGVPERTTFEDALLMIITLKSERDTFRGTTEKAWKYFHERFQGLQCGLEGTWEQACNEVVGHIRHLQRAIALQAGTTTPEPDLKLLQNTDRTALIESIPALLIRVAKLEAAVFPAEVAKSDEAPQN